MTVFQEFRAAVARLVTCGVADTPTHAESLLYAYMRDHDLKFSTITESDFDYAIDSITRKG